MKIIFAERIPPLPLPRPRTLWGLAGLRYERRLNLKLKHTLEPTHTLEHNPFFRFLDDRDIDHVCVPDFLILCPDLSLVIEAKLTYTPEALRKLREVYVPVLSLALNLEPKLKPKPLIITKNIVPGLKPLFTLKEALLAPIPLIQWRGVGPVWAD